MVRGACGFIPRHFRHRNDAQLKRSWVTHVNGRRSTHLGRTQFLLHVGCSLRVWPVAFFVGDEQTAYPDGGADLWGIVCELVGEGKTALVISQYFGAVDEAWDSVALLVGGKCVARGNLTDLELVYGSVRLTLAVISEVVSANWGFNAPMAPGAYAWRYWFGVERVARWSCHRSCLKGIGQWPVSQSGRHRRRASCSTGYSSSRASVRGRLGSTDGALVVAVSTGRITGAIVQNRVGI